MKKLSFEIHYKMYLDYIIDRIWNKHLYPTLEVMPHKSFQEWSKPDMYYIDGINKVELPVRYKGEEYLSHQIETFTEWHNKL